MDSSMDNSVLATSSIDGRRYSSDDPISSTVTSSTDVSSSLMDSASEVPSGTAYYIFSSVKEDQ